MLKRADVVRQALKDAGVEENRVRIEFMSSLDAHKLVEIIREMKKT